ncbi:normocyte-binding protein [Paenibacillus sp. SYP-B3998]|uniref:Normocyte-binding protein n=1 Tax=Paenibacillus sp. SYP-B3998 TaxID=2678564 RepID=A0A6G4A653_9BACL|nr:normocyte-binding protein [Paenibacillus sp. SYP-B3998]NEW09800.1 normocyte-binding protein [Paenibacillus sp. SYP-B3998]
MKDIILDRLSRMDDLEQRKLLKNIMTGVFLNLVDYQEDLNRQLEERVFKEVEEREEGQDIYVTICQREDIDPIHEFLYPMLEADRDKPICDLKHLLHEKNLEGEATLMTVFLQCQYRKIQELLEGKRVFQGELITSLGSYAIEVRLQQNRTYIGELEKLYHVFQKNNTPWKTINHPYANKFFNVVWTGSRGAVGTEEEILEIRVDLEEFEAFKKLDIVPMWNIERLALKNVGFPIPATDRVNFEHVLSLRKTGAEHGYLVDGDAELIRYIKRMPEELTVVSPQEKSGIWNVFKITKPIATKIGRLPYGLVSNKRKDSFTGGFARKQALTVRAKGEINRIVNSFEACEFLDLEQIDIIDRSDGKQATYGMNSFISDHVRVESDKKVMRLRFGNRGSGSFIVEDLMSFLVSEVQMYFPEYKCEGEWT